MKGKGGHKMMVDKVSYELPIITDVNPIPWFMARKDLAGRTKNRRIFEMIGVSINRFVR